MIKFRNIAIIAGVLLAALTIPTDALAQNGRNVDGYKFSNKDWVMTEYTMKWRFVNNQKELESVVSSQGIRAAEDDGDPIMDNVHITRNRTTGIGTCTATIISPEKKIDHEVMLHVQLHCIYGRWHAAPTFEKRPRMASSGM